MDRLFSIFSHFGKVKFRCDDDLLDRVHHVYTGLILILFSMVVTTKQYVGDPISCWTPGHWTAAHVRYANNACWVHNTYWVPFDEGIPDYIPRRVERQISYYQWAPFVLLVQALLFYFPVLFWRTLSSRSGIHINAIVDTAIDIQNVKPENRAKFIRQAARHLEMCLASSREYRSGRCVRFRHFLSKKCCLVCGFRYGNSMVLLYMLMKALFLANVVAQLALMNIFLGTRYRFYGIEILLDLLSSRDWQESGQFPRITMCDFVIRVLGNLHRHSVQCVLPVNMFNEKIYIFLWFWMFLLSLWTCFNFSGWLFAMVLPRSRHRFVKKYLKVGGADSSNHDRRMQEPRLILRFVHDALRADGVLVLRLIAENTGNLVVGELVNTLWSNYLETVGSSGGSVGVSSAQGSAKKTKSPHGVMFYRNIPGRTVTVTDDGLSDSSCGEMLERKGRK